MPTAKEKKTLTSLLDADWLKRLLDTIAEVSQLTIGMVDPECHPIVPCQTRGNFCGCSHHLARDVPECVEHMREMLQQGRDSLQPFYSPCIKTGFTTITVPIIIRGEFYGSWVIGKIRIRTDLKESLAEAAKKLQMTPDAISDLMEEVRDIAPQALKRVLNLVQHANESMIKLAEANLDRSQREREMRGMIQQMDASNRMVRTFIDSSDIAIYIADLYTGEILMANGAFQKQSGLTQEKLIGEKCWVASKMPYNDFCDECPRFRLIDNEGKPTGHVTWLHHNEQDDRWLRITNQAIPWANNRIGNMVMQLDVTDEQKMKLELENVAFRDRQTGLPNREKFLHDYKRQYRFVIQSGEMAALLDSTSGTSVDFICLDFSEHRHFIDTYGRDTGLELMHQLIEWGLAQDFGKSILYRMDTYEFCFAVQDRDEKVILETARKIIDRYAQPWHIKVNDQLIAVLCHIHVAIVFGSKGKVSGRDILSLISRSLDMARRQRQLYLYDETADQQAQENFALEQSLKKSVMNNMLGFEVVFQPIVELTSGKWRGLESLCRWTSPELGPISPLRFIGEAERIGLINKVGNWVLKTAIERVRDLELDGIEDFFLSVNLSPFQLMEDSFGDFVDDLLQTCSYPGNKLNLEVTESAELPFNSFTESVIQRLRDKGIRLALDDFGTGYSSFNNLKNMPVSFLKTERDFVEGIEKDSHLQYYMYIMSEIAHANGMKLIAEGIETRQQLEIIKSNGADYIQGYYFSRPLTYQQLKTQITAFYEFNPAVLTYEAEAINIQQWLSSKEAYKVTPGLFRILNQCMHILSDDKPLRQAADTVLELIGTYFRVSRAFIFVQDRGDDSSRKWRFKWSANKKKDPYFLKLNELNRFVRALEPVFRKKGLLLATEIETTPPAVYKIIKDKDVKGLAVMPIWEDDRLTGYIGLNSQVAREWSAEEAILLWNLSLLLSGSVRREKLREEAESRTQLLKEVLNSHVYNVMVCDLETDEILWSNDRLKETYLLNDDPIGLKCHQVITGSIERCEFCPVPQQKAAANSRPVTFEFYNEKLNRNFIVFSNIVHWENNRQAHVEYSIDVTDLKQSADQLEYFASTDVLTGALNRETTLSRLDEIYRHSRENDTHLTVAYAHIDELSSINLSKGHYVGDRVLQLSAEAIRKSIRSDDVIGRLSGNEFIIIFPECTPEVADKRMCEAQKILEGMKPPVPEIDMRILYSVVDNKTMSFDEGTAFIDALLRMSEERMNARRKETVLASGSDRTGNISTIEL